MVKAITNQELKIIKETRPNLKIVNVLSKENFEKKHIPGSMNIPLNKILDEAPKRLEKDDEIVVYCENFDCKASPKAAKKLESLGYKKIYDYEGGIDDWQQSGFKIVEAT